VYVLERRRAVEVWNTLMGDRDPAVARKNTPNSLRALYAISRAERSHGIPDIQKRRYKLPLSSRHRPYSQPRASDEASSTFLPHNSLLVLSLLLLCPACSGPPLMVCCSSSQPFHSWRPAHRLNAMANPSSRQASTPQRLYRTLHTYYRQLPFVLASS